MRQARSEGERPKVSTEAILVLILKLLRREFQLVEASRQDHWVQISKADVKQSLFQSEYTKKVENPIET